MILKKHVFNVFTIRGKKVPKKYVSTTTILDPKV